MFFNMYGFSVAAPTTLNSHSFDIRNMCSISFKRRQLKTFLLSTFCYLCPNLIVVL